MSYDTMTEHCSCGATFTVMSVYSAQSSVDRWRKDHRHEFKPLLATPAVRATFTLRARSARLRKGENK